MGREVDNSGLAFRGGSFMQCRDKQFREVEGSFGLEGQCTSVVPEIRRELADLTHLCRMSCHIRPS